ncbi:MAG: transcriptional regulator GcvA [SAR324 cluster bacterium]|nr:transcriptional regulator GcvA [SAR324 cluster bacterium]
MAYQLPSLNGLRAFEATARHLSFKQAGAELFVTPGAISQQVKALEEELGVPLFRRFSRKIELTEAGRLFLPPVQRAFQNISEATTNLEKRDKSGVLNISLPPAFAIKWITPRISSFQALYPDIEAHIHASNQLVDFDRQNIDLAIRWGFGKYPGLRSEHLLSVSFFPVCSPRLKEGPKPLEKPSDLAHHTLLHNELRKEWPLWIKALNLSDVVDGSKGPSFSNDGLVLMAAIEGQGVALGENLLVEKDLRTGLLVKLFDISFPTNVAYYIVCPEERWDQPKIKFFREWVTAEAKKTERVVEDEIRDYSLQDLIGAAGYTGKK